MRGGRTVAVIIPALDEEQAIGAVLAEVPAWVDRVVVVDNGSTDRTALRAAAAGAVVAGEPRRGYGLACQKGLAAVGRPDIVVFMDGDHSDYPEQMDRLVDPILAGRADLVVGSRVLGVRQPGALTPQTRFGNWLSCLLMRLFWGVRHSDLGPFRAIDRRALEDLGLSDPDFGWNVEMHIKACRRRLKVREVPVDYRRRIGKSHISGTLKGVLQAGAKILYTIFKAAWDDHRRGGRGYT